MNLTTAAALAGTNATSNTTSNLPTDPFSNNDADKNAQADNYPDKTASTAPLLPTHSFAVEQPTPQASWRRMTGGLTTQSTQSKEEKLAQISEHPGVFRVYIRKWWFLFVQWFFTFWVLGATAMSLSRADNLPSVVPMLAYTITCVSAALFL